MKTYIVIFLLLLLFLVSVSEQSLEISLPLDIWANAMI